jgi:hypothetical protein
MSEDPFAPLDATNKACLLVGQFMWRWALLESAVNGAYRKLLKLKGVEGHIATANITLRDKVAAVRTVVHIACQPDTEKRPEEAEWWKAADRDLIAITTMNGNRRNVVAHNLFGGHESGGVDFLIIKAKGKFAVPDVVWTPEDFDAVFLEIDHLCIRVREITEHIEKRRAAVSDLLSQAVNWFALPPPPEPMPAPELLGGLYHLGRLAQEHPDALSPNPKPSSKTPKAPRKKSEGRKKR